MLITILASKDFCPHCNRTVWMHRRFGRYVCRGDISASMLQDYDLLVAAGRNPGCQREFRKKKDGSTDKGA